jgi:hypothetical protein
VLVQPVPRAQRPAPAFVFPPMTLRPVRSAPPKRKKKMDDHHDHAWSPRDDKRDIVPDPVPTQAADPLVWSTNEPDDDIDQDYDRRPLPSALVFLLTAIGIGALTFLVFTAGKHQFRVRPDPPAVWPQTVTVAPSPYPYTSIILPPPAPSVIASPELAGPSYSDPDITFLRNLRADRIPYKGGDADAIVSAHMVCNHLADNANPTTNTGQAELLQRALGWTYQQSLDFVTDAVRTYCPEQAK